jgi:hypothetical protein
VNTTEPARSPNAPSKAHPHNSNHHDNHHHGESEPELPRQSWAILGLTLQPHIVTGSVCRSQTAGAGSKGRRYSRAWSEMSRIA